MTANEILALRPRIERFLRLFDECFVDDGTRHHLRVYVRGQLSNLPRKSVEPIAVAADMAPKTLQQFLTLAKWDHLLMRDRLQQRVAARHRGPRVIGVFDETGCPKKGHKTPGVQHQDCGASGKNDNCIVTVHLALAEGSFHCLLDSELFLPEVWSEDRSRCRAAGIPEAFLTAFANLVMEAGIAPGATVLIHAGASGVGLAAIQVAKHSGARVAATTRSADKVPAIASAGADLVLDTSRRDFAAEIDARWGREAVDVVLDPVGRASLAGDLKVLKAGGRIVIIATMSGADADLDLGLLMRKRARIVGSTLRARSRAEKATIVKRFKEELLPALGDGAMRVIVDAVFPAERAADAFQRMRENRNVGKILIAWRPG